ncbi:MAG TPA: chemoreceptor glutamine deamidase CheD [Chromobacteriaceae bacterium]|nr:chemoreceptor glutamine deamidase CheD [Chromobacteriaceae bacterium]
MSLIATASGRYFDKQFGREAIKLLPGEYQALAGSGLLVTLLGSCVAVCLMDRQARVSGMNHFLLPEGSSDWSGSAEPARFGVHAMELLITDMQKLGAQRHRLQAKVFGAGNMLEGMSVVNIGERNTDFIRSYLATEQIPVLAEDLLGNYARKVYFFTDSGKVMVKKLKHSATLEQEERAYRQRLHQPEEQPGGDIDLFI